MVEIWFPYGKSDVPVRIPEENLVDILKPHDPTRSLGSELAHLITEDILAVAKNAEQICIVIGNSRKKDLLSNATRSLITAFTNAGVSASKITILRTAESDPIVELGESQIVQHSLENSSTMACEGFSGDFVPSINKVAVDSQLTIAVGELMPHHLTGYSGLCDLIFPGLASEKSARDQLVRNKPMDPHELYTERLTVSSLLRNVYALGFVLNSDLTMAEASLGSFSETVNRLGKVVDEVATVEASRAADIVVMSVGGMPLDESLLRAVEALPAGLSVLKRNGALIVAAECPLGHGNTDFYAWSDEHKEARHLEARLRHRFNYYGYKAAYLSRALASHKVYLVSTIPDHYVERTFGLRAANTLNAALASAQRALGTNASVTAIPNASQVIPKVPSKTTEATQC